MKNQMTKKLVKFVGMSALSLYLMPIAQAQTTTAATSSTVNHFQECAAKNNITLPAEGSGEKLTADQKQVIWSCLKEERKAAFEGCASSNNIALPAKDSGERLSKADRQTIRQCMASQGFKLFRHHHHKSVEEPRTSEPT